MLNVCPAQQTVKNLLGSLANFCVSFSTFPPQQVGAALRHSRSLCGFLVIILVAVPVPPYSTHWYFCHNNYHINICKQRVHNKCECAQDANDFSNFGRRHCWRRAIWACECCPPARRRGGKAELDHNPRGKEEGGRSTASSRRYWNTLLTEVSQLSHFTRRRTSYQVA